MTRHPKLFALALPLSLVVGLLALAACSVKVAPRQCRERGACQMRSTSKIRQFDFGDCGPVI